MSENKEKRAVIHYKKVIKTTFSSECLLTKKGE